MPGLLARLSLTFDERPAWRFCAGVARTIRESEEPRSTSKSVRNLQKNRVEVILGDEEKVEAAYAPRTHLITPNNLPSRDTYQKGGTTNGWSLGDLSSADPFRLPLCGVCSEDGAVLFPLESPVILDTMSVFWSSLRSRPIGNSCSLSPCSQALTLRLTSLFQCLWKYVSPYVRLCA